MPIIEVNHVTKEYKLGQLTSLKQSALNSFNRLAGRPAEERKPFKALDDITSQNDGFCYAGAIHGLNEWRLR